MSSRISAKRASVNGSNLTARTEPNWSASAATSTRSHFEDWFIDAIRRRDIEEWKAKQAEKVRRRELSPNTFNGWLRVLLATLRSAVSEFELDYDPTKNVTPLDTSAWLTYTEEEPNALTVAEVPEFMAHAQALYPQHYAELALGLSTGRRPCELRPLRWKGDTSDLKWEDGILLVRRSQVIGEAADRTKTKARLRIPLPQALMDILKGHAEALPETLREKSDLLFPSRTGGYQSSSCLAKPIREIAAAAGIKKRLSPYFMRRTFQDLCRAADVHDFIARAISGHATVEMQKLYSSVSGSEVRSGLAKVISIAGFVKAREDAQAVKNGEGSGDASTETRKAG